MSTQASSKAPQTEPAQKPAAATTPDPPEVKPTPPAASEPAKPAGAQEGKAPPQMSTEDMQAAIWLLQQEVQRLQDERSQKVMEDVAPEQTALDKSQFYAKDSMLTESLSLDEAREMLKEAEEGLDLEKIVAYAVRGPYLVGVLEDNGRKIAIEHNMEHSSEKLDAANVAE